MLTIVGGHTRAHNTPSICTRMRSANQSQLSNFSILHKILAKPKTLSAMNHSMSYTAENKRTSVTKVHYHIRAHKQAKHLHANAQYKPMLTINVFYSSQNTRKILKSVRIDSAVHCWNNSTVALRDAASLYRSNLTYAYKYLSETNIITTKTDERSCTFFFSGYWHFVLPVEEIGKLDVIDLRRFQFVFSLSPIFWRSAAVRHQQGQHLVLDWNIQLMADIAQFLAVDVTVFVLQQRRI